MRLKTKVPVLMSGGGVSTFVDMFARANADDLGAPWTETTYTVASYTAANTPAEVTGTNLVTNPGLEAPYTGGVAADWLNLGSGTAEEETTIVHGGTSSQKLTRVATSDRISQAITTIVGHWYKLSAWVYEGAGTISFNIGTTNANNTLGTVAIAPTGSWVNVKMTFRASATTTYIGMWCGATAGSTGYLDDVSVIDVTFASTLALVQPGNQRYSVHSTQTASGNEKIGVALRWNAANDTGILVYINPAGQTLVVDKCISGTWTQVDSDAITVGSAKVLRVDQDSSTIYAYYDGTLITTQALTDVPAAPYAGMFNSGPNGVHTAFALTNYQGTPVFPLYVAADGNDANPGSAALPKLTIGSANTKALAINMVSEIIIGAGTFAELVTVPRSTLIYTGAGATTIIDGGSARSGLVASSKNAVTVRYMKFSACADYGIQLASGAGAAISYVTVDGATVGIALDSQTGAIAVTDCVAANCTQQGMRSKATPNTVFTRCYVHTPGDPGCYAFESEGTGTDDNSYVDCWAVGAFTAGFISKLTERCAYSGCVASGCDLAYFQKGATDTVIDHCVAYGGEKGIYSSDNAGSDPETTGLEVKSTVIAGCSVAGYEITDAGDTGADLDYNDIYNTTLAGKWVGSDYATLALWQAASSQDANSVATDPAYVDETYPNGFRLPAGSALLTAGEGGTAIGIDGA